MQLTRWFSSIRLPRASKHRQRCIRLLPCCLALLVVTILPQVAWADCWLGGSGAPTLNFNPGAITLNINTAPSTTTPIWSSGVITPGGSGTISCNNTTQAGIDQSVAGPPTGTDNTLYPTNIPGISYRLQHIAGSDQYLMASWQSNSQSLTARTNSSLTGTTQLFLYYTGPYLPPNGGVLSGPLAQWETNICNNPKFNVFGTYTGCSSTVTEQAIEYFTINATITVNVPTCNVSGGPNRNFTFALPDVTAATFVSNPTPGQTAMSLPLVNCPTGQKVFVTLTTANAYTTGGVNGVIAASGAGYAGGVGVQILQSDGSTAVTFGTALNTGTTTGSTYNINLFSRYYRTNASVTTGPVQAIATYTINYQ